MNRWLAAPMAGVLGLAFLAACGGLDDDVSLGDHDGPADSGDSGAPQDARFPTEQPDSSDGAIPLIRDPIACGEPTQCVGVPREPWITTGLGDFSLGSFALDDTHLYFMTWPPGSPEEGTLSRAHRVSGQIERVLLAPPGEALAVDDTHVYLARGADGFNVGSIWRMPKDGGTLELLVSQKLQSGHIALDDTHVYYHGIGGGHVGMHRVLKEGGELEWLAPLDEAMSFQIAGPHLVVSQVSAGHILRLPKAGGGADPLFETDWLMELAVGSGFTFFLHGVLPGPPPYRNIPFRLARVPIDGGKVEQLHMLMERPGPVVARSDAVIWGNWFFPHDGSTPSRLVPDEYWITRAAADDTEIFLGSFHGNIYKIVH